MDQRASGKSAKDENRSFSGKADLSIHPAKRFLKSTDSVRVFSFLWTLYLFIFNQESPIGIPVTELSVSIGLILLSSDVIGKGQRLPLLSLLPRVLSGAWVSGYTTFPGLHCVWRPLFETENSQVHHVHICSTPAAFFLTAACWTQQQPVLTNWWDLWTSSSNNVLKYVKSHITKISVAEAQQSTFQITIFHMVIKQFFIPTWSVKIYNIGLIFTVISEHW